MFKLSLFDNNGLYNTIHILRQGLLENLDATRLFLRCTQVGKVPFIHYILQSYNEYKKL